jgi:hypothetical protein
METDENIRYCEFVLNKEMTSNARQVNKELSTK